MPKFRILSFSFLMSAFIATAASAQPLKVVTFATDAEKTGGFLLEMTVEAFKKVGYDTRVEFVPFPRAVGMVKNGLADGLLGVYYTDERAQWLTYSDVLAESPMVFFALEKSKITYSKLEDLSKYTIGTTSGTVYPKKLSEATFLNKEPVNDYILNIRKLAAERIRLFVEKKYVVTSFISGSPSPKLKNIVALDPPLVVNKFYNAIAKTAPDAEQKIRDFNRGLQILKDEGLYTTIMNKNLHE